MRARAPTAGSAGAVRDRHSIGASPTGDQTLETLAPLSSVLVQGHRAAVGPALPVDLGQQRPCHCVYGDRVAFVDVWVLNGPNLARLGQREPDVYGSGTYAELVAACERAGAESGVRVQVRQTDAEHELISWLHDAADADVPVVLNAAAWTHTSVAVRDAAAQLVAPWVEVHLSNVHAREEFRRHSYLSAVATGVVAGLGPDGYAAAIRFLADLHSTEPAGRRRG